MKNFTLTITLFLTFPFAFFSQIQGDGGVPKTFKSIKDYKTIDTWLFSTPDLVALKQEDELYDDSGERPWRFGHNNYTELNLNNSGTWKELANGDKIWQLVLTCEEALTVNLTFSNTHIPEGNELYVYNPEKTFILGSFNQNHLYNGELGTELVPGNTAIIEYYIPKENSLGSLNVDKVTHGYRTANEFIEKAFGSSGSCNMNVNCPDGSSWVNERNSVVLLVSNGGGFCTGALINNTLNDGTPYVLTANHCYSNPANWVFRFNWESGTCNNPGSSPSFLSLSGGTLRSRRTPTDFCLVEITGGLTNNTVPSNYNPFFAGWDNSGDIPSTTVCIHHPAGDIKKISFDDDAASISQAMGSSEANSTWTVQWDRNTTTEGGSSGSPLFDQNHRIIGQLWGGGASCSNLNSPDYYGRVSMSWEPSGSNQTNQLKHWLDPNNAGASFIDGFDPSGASAAEYDAGVSGAGLNETAVCATDYIPSFTLSNPGSQTLTSAVITYDIDGGAPSTLNWSGSLAQYQTEIVTLSTVTLAAGNHSLNVEVSSPNGNTDENANNNVSVANITIEPVAETALYVTVSLLTDDYADETYMEITNSAGIVIWTEGNEEVEGNFGTGDFPPPADPTTPLENNTQYDWNVPLSSQECYTFSVYDYYGDGLGASQWQGTDGDLNLLDNGGSNIYAVSAADFGSDEASTFRNLTVGINEDGLSSFKVYPNPANEYLVLITEAEASSAFVITDLLGKTFSTGSVLINKTIINTSELSSGSYIIRLLKKDGTVEHKSFIVK
jgi:hypothetical protein